MADALPAPLPDPNVPELIQRYLNGESIRDLTKEYKRSYQILYNWMLTETGSDYEHLISRALTNRIAEADQALDEAIAPIDIARARERARFSRMDFERRRPKLYGPKQEVVSDNTIRVIIQPPPPVIDVKARRIKELEEQRSNAPHEGAPGQGSNEEEK